MHDGRLGSPSAVALFYAAGGGKNAWLSPMLVPAPPGVNADFEGIDALVRALTGEMPENAGPPDDW